MESPNHEDVLITCQDVVRTREDVVRSSSDLIIENWHISLLQVNFFVANLAGAAL